MIWCGRLNFGNWCLQEVCGRGPCATGGDTERWGRLTLSFHQAHWWQGHSQRTQDHSLPSLYQMAGTQKGKRHRAKRFWAGEVQIGGRGRVVGRWVKRKRRGANIFPQCSLTLPKSRHGKCPHQPHFHPAAADNCKRHAWPSSLPPGLLPCEFLKLPNEKSWVRLWKAIQSEVLWGKTSGYKL